MKKLISLTLSLLLVVSLFTACGQKTETDSNNETNSNNATTETTAKSAKTGLAVVTSFDGKSKDAADDADGLAQTNSTAVAVLVDEDGVITNAAIDVVQTKINFSAEGKITTDKAAEFISKQELKEAYGMVNASPIGKEWYEQADALREYIIGKTIDEVKGIALDETGHPTSEDLTSSVTMIISDVIDAVEKAVANAQDLGASAEDQLGLGIISNLGKSADAGEQDGLAQAYTHYGVLSLDADGKITSSIVNASQGNINFSAEGNITSDLTAEVKSKLELGEDYGMRVASPIGKEWFEQSEAFTSYITGKTVADVTGIALEGGAATSEDLTSSVTITITDFLTVIEKAGTSAR